MNREYYALAFILAGLGFGIGFLINPLLSFVSGICLGILVVMWVTK